MDIFQQLKNNEGYRQFPYLDTKGKTTIGYGFNLTDVGLSREECDAIQAIRVRNVKADLTRTLTFYPSLNEPRQAVLEDMVYNMGLDRFLGFHKAIQAMTMEDWDGAAEQLLESEWAEEVGARADRLAKQLASGEWVS